MATTADKTSARNRARQALADKQRKRRERDERMEVAATRYFAAADALIKARREAGEAIKALVDEGEARSEIAELLGVTTREVKNAIDALADDGDADADADGNDQVQPGTESSDESGSEIDQPDGSGREH